MLVLLTLTLLEPMLALLELDLTLPLKFSLDAVMLVLELLLVVLLLFVAGGVIGMEFAVFGDFPSVASLLLLLLLDGSLADGALINCSCLHSILSLGLLSDVMEWVEELVALLCASLMLMPVGLVMRGSGCSCEVLAGALEMSGVGDATIVGKMLHGDFDCFLLFVLQPFLVGTTATGWAASNSEIF